MVFFTCNNCGESLKKVQVVKHYQFRCRNPIFVTCVDCLKDFRGQEYDAHTKCITEDERYGGVNYVAKPNANKGERKQQEWINVVQNLLITSSNLTNAERNLLTTLSKNENIPRKKAKFLNFIQSALGNRSNINVAQSVWTKMEAAFKEAKENGGGVEKQRNTNEEDTQKLENVDHVDHRENNVAENQNNENLSKENGGTSEEKENQMERKTENIGNNMQNGTSDKKLKKRSLVKSSEDQKEQPAIKRKNINNSEKITDSLETVRQEIENDKFNWKSTILEVVASKGEISLKKLRKKVIASYLNHCLEMATFEKADAKFNKKLSKIKGIVISEEKVKLG